METGEKITVWVLMDRQNDLWRPTTTRGWKKAVEFIQYKVDPGRPFMFQKDTDRRLEEEDFNAPKILDTADH